MLPPDSFYDAIATLYDGMTRFEDRIARESNALRPLVMERGIRTAADMGCGTGVHSIALAQLGVRTTGYDISDRMLRLAREHASGLDTVSFVRGDFLAPLPDPVDAIFCLGNTLPHAPDAGALMRIIAHWASALRRSGVIVLQLLHYSRVLARRERIIGVRKTDGIVTVRFYDFTEPRLTFNILALAENPDGTFEHALHSTQLTPFTLDDVARAARGSALRMETYGSLLRTPFTPDSTDLVVLLSAE